MAPACALVAGDARAAPRGFTANAALKAAVGAWDSRSKLVEASAAVPVLETAGVGTACLDGRALGPRPPIDAVRR